MPELKNLTPFPNFRYYSRDNENREFGIVIVKATYEIADDGTLVAAEEQAPMIFTDKCHGEVNISSLWHPSDLVSYKPATDIVINAIAFAPGGKPSESWECGVAVSDKGRELLAKDLRVTGPRRWVPDWKRPLNDDQKEHWRDYRKYFSHWTLSSPEPISSLPLHYEYAYGGVAEAGHDEEGNPRFDTDHHNPLGRGKISEEWTDHTKPVTAPQIECPDDPISEPYRRYQPQNLGSIPPAWLPRRPRGGTYDQNWIDSVWPAWPSDYSFDYHNSAHPDLTVSPHLKGGETIVLKNLTAQGDLILSLPRMHLLADFIRADTTCVREAMVLDTVLVDMTLARRKDWRVCLSWRVRFTPDVYVQAIIHSRQKHRVIAETAKVLQEA